MEWIRKEKNRQHLSCLNKQEGLTMIIVSADMEIVIVLKINIQADNDDQTDSLRS
jgi:hypothetical protein